MFTGLIEEVGKIGAITRAGGTPRMTFLAARCTRELRPGDSVAVSGVCLTALQVERGRSFRADLAAETLSRTSLGERPPGAGVNLELPAKAGSRLDGHIVQGHVDGTGTLRSLKAIPGAKDYLLHIEIPQELGKYVVEKGSIAIEGISLTVAKVEGTEVRVAILPRTYEVTNLHTLSPGSRLNLEVDVLAKYAEKMLRAKAASSLTVKQLVEQGF